MNPTKVRRDRLNQLTDLPNIGPSIAGDVELLGIKSPKALTGRDPFEMYNTLCAKTGVRHDPCVLDVFISITRFMNGEDPKPWWDFTEERKSVLARDERSKSVSQ